jgi:2-polyprenyl-3-methyl-5-hydroxy-6-metoxy-1,4-benzoquinol methylase
VTSERAQHWDAVYGSKAEDAVSWFQESADTSLELLDELELPAGARLVDVGGGASRLVDSLLDRGGFELTVLDVAAEGLAHARARLGGREESVTWVVADVTRWRPAGTYDVWHDRAVFHFLGAEEDRRHYVRTLNAAVRPGGHVVVATFAEDGPEQCSGLPVVRYDAASLADALGPGVAPVASRRQVHRTPWGGEQPFTWLALRRTSGLS